MKIKKISLVGLGIIILTSLYQVCHLLTPLPSELDGDCTECCQ